MFYNRDYKRFALRTLRGNITVIAKYSELREKNVKPYCD